MGTDDGRLPLFRRGGVIDPLTGKEIEVGKSGGETTHKLKESELPKVQGVVGTAGGPSGKNDIGIFNEVNGAFQGADSCPKVLRTSNDSYSEIASYTKFELRFGNDQPHNNMPLYIGVCAWRRIE